MPFIVPTPLGATAASTGSWTDLAASQFFVVQERAGASFNSTRTSSSTSANVSQGGGPGPSPGGSAHSALDGPVRHPIILASPATSWPTQLAVAIVQCSYRILVKPTAQGPRIVVAIADNRPAILADWLVVELQLFPRAVALEPGTPLTPILHADERSPAPLHRSGSTLMFSDFDFRLVRLVTEFVAGDQQFGSSHDRAPTSDFHSSSDSPTHLPRSSPRHLSSTLRRYLDTIESLSDCHLVAHSDCTVVDTWADETAPYPATLLLSRHHWVLVPWPNPDDGTLPLPNATDTSHCTLRCPYFCVSTIVPDPKVSTFASPATALGSTAAATAGVSVPCTLTLVLTYDATNAPPSADTDSPNSRFKLQLVFPSPEIVQVFMTLVQDSLYNLARSTETRTSERDARHRLGGDLGFSLTESQSNDSLASPSALRSCLPTAKTSSKAPMSRLTVPKYKSSSHLLQLQRNARLSRLFGVQFHNDEDPLEFPVRIWVTSKFSPASHSSLVVPVWSGAEVSLITGPGTSPGSSSAAPIVYRMTMWVMSDCLLFMEADPTKSIPMRLHLPFLELATVSKIPHGPTSWGITAALWGSISTLAFLLRSRAGRTWGIEVVEPSHASALYDVIMGRLRQVRLPPLPVTPTSSAPLTPVSGAFSSSRDMLGILSLPTPPPLPDSASALSGSFTSLSVATELDVCNTPLDFLFPSLDPRSNRHEKHLAVFWESFSKSVLLHAPHVELGPHLFALYCGGIVDRQLSSAAAAALAGEGAGSTLVTYDGLLVPSANASTDSLPNAAPPNRLRNRRTVIGFPCSMRPALWSLLARRAPDLASNDVFDPVASPFPGTGPNTLNPHHHQDGWSFSDFQARPRRKSAGDALSIGGHIPPLALVREYAEYVKLGPHPEWEEEIEKDIHRSLPEHPAFETNGIGQSALRRVLHAFSHRNPAVGYAQAMNLITCQLLRACGEAQAFAALCWIAEYLLPTHFTRTLLGALVDQQVFETLLQRFLPKVSAKLQTMHTGIAAITIAWFLSAFMSVVPSSCALVVLDGVFLDRERFVFLLAVGIVSHLEQLIVKAEDELHMMVLIRDFFKLFEDAEAGVALAGTGNESDGESPVATVATAKEDVQGKVDAVDDDDTQLRGLALLQAVIITSYTRFGPLLTHDTIAELRDNARFAAVHKLESDFRKAQLRTITAQAGLPPDEAERVYTHFQWTILTKGQTPGMLTGAGTTVFMARVCKWTSIPGPLEGCELPDFGTLILRFQLGSHRDRESGALDQSGGEKYDASTPSMAPAGLDFAGAAAAYRDLTRGSSSKRLRFFFALHDLDRDGVLDSREADLLMYHLAWFLGGGKRDWDALRATVSSGHARPYEDLTEVGMCLWNVYHALSSTTASLLTQEMTNGHSSGTKSTPADVSLLGLGTGVSLNAFLLALSVDPVIVEKMHFYS